MPTLRITSDNLVISAHAGESLQELSATHPNGILFGCFSARCGACRIRVVENPQGLSPVGDMEMDLLESLSAGADERLACQCLVLGDVTIEVVPPR